jgi:hypothetical protein
LGCVDNNVLKMIMKISKTERPFMLRDHRRSDLAAPIIGIKQQNIISRGMIERNNNDTIARTILMSSFARGSSRWITESWRVY